MPSNAALVALLLLKRERLATFTGEIGKAVGKVLRVLLDQKRSRSEYGDLFAAHHCYKRGAQGDFGFTEADIAAHKAVHRLRLCQVFNHGGNSGGLVFGFFVAEAVGKRRGSRLRQTGICGLPARHGGRRD